MRHDANAEAEASASDPVMC